MSKSNNSNLEVVKEWIDAANAHDVKQIVSTLHPKFEYELEYSTVKGKGGAEEGWKLFFDAFTDFHYETELTIDKDDYVVLKLRMTGIHTGPFRFVGTNSLEKPIEPNNRAIDIPTCAIFKIEDGKIIRLWSYWDTATMLNQMKA